MKSQILIIVSCLSLLIPLANCQKDENDFTAAEVMLPIEENIPHFNSDHILLQKNHSIINDNDFPQEIAYLKQYLETPGNVSLVSLPVLVGEPSLGSGFDIVSAGDGRVILLDAGRNQILEIDLQTHDSETLAEFGRGPGDMHFPVEIGIYDNNVYAARMDGYLSRFDCYQTPCEFTESISFDFIPSSFTKVRDDFAVLSTSTQPVSESDNENDFGANKPVRIIGSDGVGVNTFGDLYDAAGHSFLLTHPDFSAGFIRYSPSEHVYILNYSRFPFIYVYDAESLNLKTSFKISEFSLGQQRYLPDTRRLYTVEGDISLIRNISVITETYLLIETLTMRNRLRDIMGTIFDYSIDFYVVDLTDSGTFYIGGYEGEQKEQIDKSINLLPEGLIIYDYKDGSLNWVKI